MADEDLLLFDSQHQTGTAPAGATGALDKEEEDLLRFDSQSQEGVQTEGAPVGSAIEIQEGPAEASRPKLPFEQFVTEDVPAAAGAVADVARTARDAITGGDAEDLPEIGEFVRQKALQTDDNAAIGHMMNALNASIVSMGSDQAMAPHLQKAFDIAEDDGFTRGPGDSIIVKTKKGERFYINAPGVSEADISKGLASMAIVGPLIAAATSGFGAVFGPGALATFAGSLSGGFLGSNLQNQLAERLGSRGEVTNSDILSGSLIGAVADTFGGPMVTALRRVITPVTSRLFRQTGRLSPQVRKALKAINVDPDNLSPEALDTLQAELQTAKNPAAAARVVAARDLPEPVHLSRAQASLDPLALQTEADVATNAPFFAAQGEALEQGVRSVEPRPGQAAGEGGKVAQARLIQKEAASRAAFRGAYSQASELGNAAPVFAPRARLAKMQTDTMAELSENQFLRPAANPKLFKFIDDATETLRDVVDEGTGDINWRRADDYFRRLKVLERGPGVRGSSEDAAIQIMKKHYRRWEGDMLEKTMAEGGFSGNTEAVRALRKADQLRVRHRERFEGDNIIKRLTARKPDGSLELTVNPEQVSNTIFGRTKLGYTKDTLPSLRKLREGLGADSAEWDDIRQEGFLRLFRNQDADKAFQADKFAKELADIKKEPAGRATYEFLFSPDERKIHGAIAQMQGFDGSPKSLIAHAKQIKTINAGIRNLGRRLNSASLRFLAEAPVVGGMMKALIANPAGRRGIRKPIQRRGTTGLGAIAGPEAIRSENFERDAR